MTVCVGVTQQPGGPMYLTLLPMQTDLSKCAYTVEDGSSTAWRELGNMSIENASTIGAAVGLVWAIAWGFKFIARTIRNTDSNTE